LAPWDEAARRALAALLLTSLLIAGAACQAPPPPPQPPAPVTIAIVEKAAVPVELRALGSVEAIRTVAVKPQVGGLIIAVGFREGQEVKNGQTLFRIDPRPFEAALAQAEAALARDRAQLGFAERKRARTADLFAQRLGSQEALDQDDTARDALRATVQADEAAVRNARLQLEYATIASPIAGRAGDLAVDLGNVVKANPDAALVTIRQVAPIHVRFAVPEKELPAVRRYAARGPLAVKAFPGGGAPPATGRLVFLDNAVDATTGTILLKGEFENADGALWPGQTVDVALVLDEGTDAVVIPDEALQTGQEGAYVYVLAADKTAGLRAVTPGRAADGKRVIEKGLAVGETVITDGQLRLTPGKKAVVRPAAKSGPGDVSAAK
jgi:multidrug efflux system membrane fusion protein